MWPWRALRDAEIAEEMQSYWTNFAKAGDPNGAGLPKWPKYDASARGYIEFTDNGPIAREGLLALEALAGKRRF